MQATGDSVPSGDPPPLRLAAKVKEIAAEKDVTPAQLAITWVPARGDNLVPIPGTKRRTYLEQNAAADIALTEDGPGPHRRGTARSGR